MKSKKHKKKLKWRKKDLEKTATPLNNLQGLIHSVQSSTAIQPSFRDILMSRRRLQPRQQQLLAPNYIPQSSIGMDQYNRIRDQNSQKQQETIDYKKLIEEEKSKSKTIE